MRAVLKYLLAVAVAVLAATCGSAAEPIRIAFIDGLSGPFANVGEENLRHFQLRAELANAQGGVLGGAKLEIVPLDSKSSPQEALIALRQVIDQRIHYVAQGNSSSVALALSDAIVKHNARNPDSRIVFLNYAAVDPALTNDKCSFWHFRFTADSEMKMQALITYMALQPRIRRVYLINQDYAHGQAVSRYAKRMLAAKRPDVKIVGDDLHLLGKVKDFAPYVAKIKAAGADAVITGNWGNDLTLLVRAAQEIGLNADFYTYYAGSSGGPTAFAEAGLGRVKQVSDWHPNIRTPAADSHVVEYRTRYPDAKEDLFLASIRIAVDMLVKAIQQTGTADPLAVARAFEGMYIDDDSGPVWIVPENHQLATPQYISTFVRADGKEVKFGLEKTAFGFKTEMRFAPEETLLPTTCRMERP